MLLRGGRARACKSIRQGGIERAIIVNSDVGVTFKFSYGGTGQWIPGRRGGNLGLFWHWGGITGGGLSKGQSQ